MWKFDTPTLPTPRGRLRRFTPADLPALFQLLRDESVNRFLPWFPARTPADAQRFFAARIAAAYAARSGDFYAICGAADEPLGYLTLGGAEPYDLGYALRQEAWGQGYATEAARTLLQALQAAGHPYITATHDVENPRSGAVMRRLGLRYCYSYVEQWQPKDYPVTFRLYQKNLDGAARTYRGYWDAARARCVEPGLGAEPLEL